PLGGQALPLTSFGIPLKESSRSFLVQEGEEPLRLEEVEGQLPDAAALLDARQHAPGGPAVHGPCQAAAAHACVKPGRVVREAEYGGYRRVEAGLPGAPAALAQQQLARFLVPFHAHGHQHTNGRPRLGPGGQRLAAFQRLTVRQPLGSGTGFVEYILSVPSAAVDRGQVGDSLLSSPRRRRAAPASWPR